MVDRTRNRTISLVFGAAGAACLLIALLADVVPIRLLRLDTPGFGKRQLALAVLGAGLLVLAVPGWRGRVARLLAGAQPLGPGQCVLLGVWFGLLAGFLEVGHQLVLLQLVGAPMRLPIDFVWIVPALYLALFGAVGIAFAVPAALPLRLSRLPIVVFVFTLPAIWGLTLIYEWLDRFAAVVLSAGLALWLTRRASKNPQAFMTLVRRTTPWFAGVVIVLGVGVTLSHKWRESSEVAALPPPTESPNILLVVLDTVRSDHLGCYNYSRDTTPNIDRLAENSVVFERAISTSPWTLPAHATLFTGRYPHQVSCDWLVPLDATDRTLAEALAARGYVTAGFVGNIGYCARWTGLARGFIHYRDYILSPHFVAYCSGILRYLYAEQLNHIYRIRNDARQITDHFLDWLPENRDRPFFAFLNYFDAHHLYVTDPEYQTKFGKRGKHVLQNVNSPDWTAEEIAEFEVAYDGCLAFLDHQFGRVVEHLEREGLLDNTLIVITADHGEQFGENGMMSHGNSLYRPLLHSPLIVHFPRQLPAGKRAPEFVSLRDVPATILDVLGFDDDAETFPGRSLDRCWTPDPAGRAYSGTPVFASVTQGINTHPWEPITLGPLHSLFADGMHYIRTGDDRDLLFDFAADPREENNLAETPEGAATAAKMRERSLQILSER